MGLRWGRRHILREAAYYLDSMPILYLPFDNSQYLDTPRQSAIDAVPIAAQFSLPPDRHPYQYMRYSALEPYEKHWLKSVPAKVPVLSPSQIAVPPHRIIYQLSYH